MDTVSKWLINCNTQVEYIPPGLTGICQPMDVSVMKVFKDHLRELYLRHHIDAPFPVSSSSSRRLITSLVEQAWDLVSPQAIVNGYVMFGLVPIGPRDVDGRFRVAIPMPESEECQQIVMKSE